jgi:membrane protein YdbS with pleckstrin-like domain
MEDSTNQSIPPQNSPTPPVITPPLPVTAISENVGIVSASNGFQQVDPKSVTAERIAGMILLAVLVTGALAGFLIWGIVLFASAKTRFPWVVWGAALLGVSLLLTAFGWLLYAWPAKDHRHTFWRLDAHGLDIQKGVWWRHRITIPRDRIQHTDVEQGPLMRRYSLAKLVIHTAGTHAPSIALPGLSMEIAQQLKDELTQSKSGTHVGHA